MLPAFLGGCGGRLGSGRHYMSWIAIDDAASALTHLLMTPGLTGAVNVVAPHPVRNEEFTGRLAQVLRRPALLPLPDFAIRGLFGTMGDEVLLSSTRVSSARLEASGFEFRYPQISGAFRHVLGR